MWVSSETTSLAFWWNNEETTAGADSSRERWQETTSESASRAGYLPCCCHLEILKHLRFEPGFYQWTLMGHWSIPVSRGGTHQAPTVLCHCTCTQQRSVSQGHGIPEDAARGSLVRLTCSVRLCLSVCGRLRGQASHWTRNFLQMQKEGNCLLKNTNLWGTLITFLIPVISQE